MQSRLVHRRDSRTVAGLLGEGAGVHRAQLDEHLREGAAVGAGRKEGVHGQADRLAARQGLPQAGLVVCGREQALTACRLIVRIAQSAAQEEHVSVARDRRIGREGLRARAVGQPALVQPADIRHGPAGQVGKGYGIGLGWHVFGRAEQAHQHDRGLGAGHIAVQVVSGLGACKQAERAQQVGIRLLGGRRRQGGRAAEQAGRKQGGEQSFYHKQKPSFLPRATDAQELLATL